MLSDPRERKVETTLGRGCGDRGGPDSGSELADFPSFSLVHFLRDQGEERKLP